MDMAKLRLAQLAEHGELLQRYGARFQLLGKREMVRQDVLDAIDHAIEITKKNKRHVFGIDRRWLTVAGPSSTSARPTRLARR
jgi:ditrans,polycis-polyprenyl diphosphate synthase